MVSVVSSSGNVKKRALPSSASSDPNSVEKSIDEIDDPHNDDNVRNNNRIGIIMKNKDTEKNSNSENNININTKSENNQNFPIELNKVQLPGKISLTFSSKMNLNMNNDNIEKIIIKSPKISNKLDSSELLLNSEKEEANKRRKIDDKYDPESLHQHGVSSSNLIQENSTIQIYPKTSVPPLLSPSSLLLSTSFSSIHSNLPDSSSTIKFSERPEGYDTNNVPMNIHIPLGECLNLDVQPITRNIEKENREKMIFEEEKIETEIFPLSQIPQIMIPVVAQSLIPSLSIPSLFSLPSSSPLSLSSSSSSSSSSSTSSSSSISRRVAPLKSSVFSPIPASFTTSSSSIPSPPSTSPSTVNPNTEIIESNIKTESLHATNINAHNAPTGPLRTGGVIVSGILQRAKPGPKPKLQFTSDGDNSTVRSMSLPCLLASLLPSLLAYFLPCFLPCFHLSILDFFHPPL